MRKVIAAFFLFFSVSASAVICPDGMGVIPATSPYSGQDYCMMKKEAVRNTLAGTFSWHYVTQAVATAQCQALYPQGDLPINALWQAALRRAETEPDNWTGGVVGSGTLKTDLKISDGAGGYSVFEDMGDGHWEFVVGAGPTGNQVTAGYIYTLTNSAPNTFTTNGLTGNAKFHFGPGGTYGSGAELGVTTNRASSYIMRGGDDNEPGAFGTALNHSGNAALDVSFRCVCPKNQCGYN